MKLINKIFVVLLALCLWTPGAEALTVKVQAACGLAASDLEIEVWNPPGGYLKVNPDMTATGNVPAGTKMSVLKSPMSKNYDVEVLGPWTEATEGGVLPVTCRSGMCPKCADRASFYQERYDYCMKNNLWQGHDALQYCSGWMGTCDGPITVGGGIINKTCARF